MKCVMSGFKLGAALAVLLASQVTLALPAAAQDAFEDYNAYNDYYSPPIEDPLEVVNRGMFKFNEAFDTILIRPVAKTYVFIVPQFGRDRIHNALNNLQEPVTMLNGFLQADPERGFTAMWRFIINSTLGVAGLFDFAGHNFDLTHREEDFGQTMGVYGLGHGPYIVLPLLGPSSGRDAFGRVVDFFSNPFNYVEDDKFVYGRLILNGVDARSRNLELIDEIYRTSVDPYATIRSAYAQHRDAQVKNNQPSSADLSY